MTENEKETGEKEQGTDGPAGETAGGPPGPGETSAGPEPASEESAVDGEEGAGRGAEVAALREELEAELPEDADVTARLSEEILEELAELDRLRDRHLRLAAEFENYRKRTRRELAGARERAQAALAERLLDAVDDLGRVAEQSPEETDAESLHEGILLARKKLLKELGDAGLSRIEAEGERFDPELHEALLTTPVDDPEEDRVVARVLVNGWRFGDRVLRPARVEVKRYEEPEEEAEDGDGADD